MRTRRKKMKKSSLRGSGPAWALKADCPLFDRGGRTLSPSHPPSSGRLIGPWPARATCQSHWGDGQRWAPTSLSPSWSLLLFSPSVEGDGELLFCKERRISLFLQPADFTSSILPTASSRRSQKLFFSHWPFANSSLLSLIAPSCSPPEQLSPRHSPSFVPTGESAVDITVPRRFPTLLCCYSNSSKEAAVLKQPRRNPHVLIWTLPSIHVEPEPMSSRDKRKPEHIQPVYELFSRPVRLAGLAVIVIEKAWLAEVVCAALPQNCSLLSGRERSRQHRRITQYVERQGRGQMTKCTRMNTQQ